MARSTQGRSFVRNVICRIYFRLKKIPFTKGGFWNFNECSLSESKYSKHLYLLFEQSDLKFHKLLGPAVYRSIGATTICLTAITIFAKLGHSEKACFTECCLFSAIAYVISFCCVVVLLKDKNDSKPKHREL